MWLIMLLLDLTLKLDLDQWNKIIQQLGTPPDDFLEKLGHSVRKLYASVLCIISYDGI